MNESVIAVLHIRINTYHTFFFLFLCESAGIQRLNKHLIDMSFLDKQTQLHEIYSKRYITH